MVRKGTHMTLLTDPIRRLRSVWSPVSGGLSPLLNRRRLTSFSLALALALTISCTKEVPFEVEVVREVPVEVEVIKEVPVEVVKVVTVEVPVEVVKEVEAEKEVENEVEPRLDATTPESDRAALEALYDAAGGDTWNNNGNWKSDSPLDTWHGVKTDRVGRVTELHLFHEGLRGSIPPELGDLTNLSILALFSNHLTGPIPPELGNLTNLSILDLGYNDLTGPIPPELGNLTKLTELYLGENRLSGSIPPELDSLTALSELSLYGNALIGPIPPGIDEFARGKNIRVSLMDDRAALEALYDAAGGDTWNNNGNWKSDSPLDTWHGVKTDRVGRVTELHLFHEGLRGSIPPELGDLANLFILALFSNHLTGPIPPELGNLTNLSILDLGTTT